MKTISRKKAIEEKCKECIYEQGASGTWRQQVDMCTSHTCPLYPVRPTSATYKEDGGRSRCRSI